MHWIWTAFCSSLCLIQSTLSYSPEVPGSNSIFEDSSRSECPIAFVKIGDKCYFYGHFKLNWFRAMEFCHSFGESVSLACIETKEENEDIKSWLIQNGDHTTGVWVGGSDNGHVGRWAWFPTGQLIREFNWGPSQPNGGDQHCMYIVGGYLGYQWADFHCGFEMTFLCEYQVNNVEAWRRRRQMVNPRKTEDKQHDDVTFQNEVEPRANDKKLVIEARKNQDVQQNSVLISAPIEKNPHQPGTKSNDLAILNFLRSIVMKKQ